MTMRHYCSRQNIFVNGNARSDARQNRLRNVTTQCGLLQEIHHQYIVFGTESGRRWRRRWRVVVAAVAVAVAAAAVAVVAQISSPGTKHLSYDSS
jgi:hypothetical protein